jgi:multidrug/hemolysin transport system ATP-binding protein
MDPIIKVRNFKKSYGDFAAVKDVSLEVQKGELFAFLGPNGAGKSTTIDTLCTLNSYEHGSITIAGYDLKKNADEIRKKIGVVFQDSLLDRKLTVRENLRIRAGFYYSSKNRIEEAVKEAMKNADITDFGDRVYGKLSGGQRRRADIARALLNTPSILFLDEPTTGLDPQTRKHVWETILKLKKDAGMTVFLTTHYMEEAAEADHVVIIDSGEVVAAGTPLELKQSYCYDHLDIEPCCNEKAARITEYLKKKSFKWKEKAEQIEIALNDTAQAIDLLGKFRNDITGFEVKHGSMDDVFLNITGKEIRE